MDPQTLASQFLDHYYSSQSGNRAALLDFYTENSCLSYNGENCKGIKAIKHKIESLGFNSIKYNFDNNFDIQPGLINDSFLIVVTGQLNMDNETTFNFTQTFQLAPNGKGGYFCKFERKLLLIPK